ncbi:NTP transferase domain-containing protein [Halomarina halobia]|uniref:NTP transferase domain-containing protein n=1 Tax=Halomarina halobia TaxID=3033386 RepID=A0ABD6AFM1_9EURY|nr:nucleotidyltransferase family protein [Halomarina sp. PSR21]
MTDGNDDGGRLPVVDRTDVNDREPVRQGSVAGVVLAAGTGSRFGPENKLLASLDGTPVVERTVRTVDRGGLSPLVVVLGHEADRVETALGDVKVGTVYNADYEAGQATSVATGIEAVRDRADAALIALGDMPLVAVESIRTLVRAYRVGIGDVLAAGYEGRRGNPVVFDERYFSDLTTIRGDVGGRRLLLEGDRSILVETGDPYVRRDVDTPADLESIATGR